MAELEGLNFLLAATSKDAVVAFFSTCFRCRHDLSAVRAVLWV
jgi:hypothetical protein